MPPIVDIRRLAVFVVLLIMNEKERNPMPFAVSEGICVARPRSNPKLLMPRQKNDEFSRNTKKKRASASKASYRCGFDSAMSPSLVVCLEIVIAL